MITIINYGAGNLKSIQNMLKKIGEQSKISNSVDDIVNAEKLILPGVGHFDYGMAQLKKSGLIPYLNEKVLEKRTPILGVCLGTQMFGSGSEEGSEKGLGWLDMKCVKFDKARMGRDEKIPNMGWNTISLQKTSKLITNPEDFMKFYFVHSYHMVCGNNADVLANSEYGYTFASAVQKENIFGVQFHPEKSHKYGMELLRNFSKI